MADRSVSVNLRLKIAAFEAGSKAAARNLKGLNRKLAETGGFATGMRKKLEAAVKKLPKVEIDANSKPADLKVAALRARLEKLAKQEIGLDIDAGSALGEMAAIQAELEAVERNASFELRAGTSGALAEIRAIQAEVKRIDDESVRVDVDTGSAMAEIGAVENQLRKLDRNASIGVRADAGAALGELVAVNAAASRVDGRTARVRVDADVSGALFGIAAVGAALVALPSAASVGFGVGALAAAFGAAGVGAAGFAAVAVPSLGRVNEALRETASAAGGGGAGGAMKSAAKSAAEAAASALQLAQAQDRVKDSAAAVVKSQRAVQDALRSVRDAQEEVRASQANAAVAAERVTEAQAAGARRVADAERALADAHRATQAAVEDLTRARERAIERIEDLELATRRGVLDEEGAQIALEKAKARLDAINADPKSTDLSRREADLAYREALLRLDEVRERQGDLAKEKAESDRRGVEGSDEVTAAKERIIEAQRREAEAAAAVGDAQVQAAQDVAAAQRDAAKASQDAARAYRDIGDAQRKVREAQDAVVKAQRDELRARQQLKVEMLQQKAALEQVGAAAGGGGGAASKMAELSKAEKELAKDIKKFSESYEKWQKSLQPDIFPAIRSGMDLMTTGMKTGTPLIKASAGALDTLAQKTNAGLKSDQWQRFFDDLTVSAPRAIEGLGTATGNVAGGLAGIVQAFLPYTDDLSKWIEDITQDFENWGQGLGESQGFKDFVAYVQANAPNVGRVLENLATLIGKIIQAAGGPIPDFLVALSDRLAAMDPAQIEAIAKGVGFLVAAIKLGLTLKVGAFVVLADVLGRMSPGQIEAVALAVAGLIIAVKGYQAFSGMAKMWDSFSAGLEKVREKAKATSDTLDKSRGKMRGFTDGLGELTDKLGGLGGLATSAAVAGGLLILNDRLNANADAASRFAEKVTALGGGNIDQEITAVTKAIEEQRQQIGFAILDTIYFSDAEREAADKVEALEAKLSDLKHQKELDAIASKTAGDAAGEHGKKVGELNTTLDTFAGKTNAYQAMRNMETAYKDAASALAAANGKLSISRDMTDKQRDAVILAREKFAGYIESIRLAADGAQTLSGKTSDGTKAVLEQLPKLAELAGKSSEAKSQILLLAQAYGISAKDAEKAMKGGRDLRDVLAELKSKQIKIDMDTKEAEERLKIVARHLEDLQRRAQLKLVGGDNPTSARGNAWGGIQYADGRPDYMAAGGIRSLGSSPSAMIARSPYMISGRSGPDVVFGEAGMEAYIPLDASKRGRGLQILQEAAGIMGMAVVPNKIQAASTAAGGSIPGSGAASVTVTGVDALRSSLDATAVGLTASLGGATNTLDATLGSAGTLTSSVAGVGEAAGHLAGEVTGWGEVIAVQVPPLTDAVTQLGDAISAAAAAGGKGNTGSKGDERSPRGGSSNSKGNVGSKGDERSPRDAAKAEPKKVEILGATSGTAGVALPAAPTNWAQVSKPVQSYGGFVASPATASSGSTSQGGSADQNASGGPMVQIQSMQVREQADIAEVAARISMRRRGRG